MLKHYVEFFYPGSFFSETESKEVPSQEAPVTLPDRAYAYRFFSRNEVLQDGELWVGKAKYYSPITYYGEEMTLEQVKNLTGNYAILVSNMECNGWNRVVRTKSGQFMALNAGDRVLPLNGPIEGREAFPSNQG